ncbi:MAG: WbqC family protein [Nitrospira sp.]
MRVAAIQSSFLPWRGYFDFIASVDVFVFLDDIQYSKNGWRNRNRIKTSQGPRWITVPVRHRSLAQLIADTEIDDRKDWRGSHMRLWHEHYGTALYYRDLLELLDDMERDTVHTISELNIALTRKIAVNLQIGTQTMLSSDLRLSGTKTDRLIDLVKKLHATTYLSGASADVYLDKDAFRKNGIRLEYKSYDYDPYPQLWGPFEGAVTILDLIANCGSDAKKHIRSRTPDRVIIE